MPSWRSARLIGAAAKSGLTDSLQYSDALLRALLSRVRTIAMPGASLKPERPSNGVMRFLQGRGYRVIPINSGQAGKTLLGERIYARLADIPDRIDLVDIFRNRAALGRMTDEAIAAGAEAVWMQLGLIDAAAAGRAEAAGLTVIMNRCPAIEIPRLYGSADPHA
jgi:predicted CoA-binding protein